MGLVGEWVKVCGCPGGLVLDGSPYSYVSFSFFKRLQSVVVVAVVVVVVVIVVLATNTVRGHRTGVQQLWSGRLPKEENKKTEDNSHNN